MDPTTKSNLDFTDKAVAAIYRAGLEEERARVVDILNNYREQAATVEPPELREQLLLTLGLIRSQVNAGNGGTHGR